MNFFLFLGGGGGGGFIATNGEKDQLNVSAYGSDFSQNRKEIIRNYKENNNNDTINTRVK